MNILIEKFKQRNEISTFFFYILYFCLGMYYPLYSFTRQTFPGYLNAVTLFYHTVLILLLVKVILQKNSVLDWLFLIILLYLCYKSYQYNYDFYNIFGTMMFLCCAKNLSLPKLILFDFYIRMIRCILFFILPFCGLMINKINIYVGGRERTFFGWTHPNMMGLDFLLLSMDILYLRREKKKWYDCFLYLGFIVLLDVTANSRTAESAILLLIIIHLLSLALKEPLFHKLIVFFTSCAFLLCVGIPLFGTMLYFRYPEAVLQYGGTLGSRLYLNSIFYQRNGSFGFYGFPIFDEDCLDMLFAYIGLHWGICAFLIISAAVLYTIYRAGKEQHTAVLILLLLFLVYGWMETAEIYPAYSYFSLLLGYYIMNRTKSKWQLF